MHYEGNIIRPPSEADRILLQVTVGCSHNNCTFCGAYKDKRFRFKEIEQISRDLDYAEKHFPRSRRLFLCDGDALILPQNRLVEILSLIKAKLPTVGRIGTYANAKSIARKRDKELLQLRDLGLHTVYLGLESGDDKTLDKVQKGVTVAEQIEQSQRIKTAGIKLSLTALLGVAGTTRSLEHAQATGVAITAIAPDFVGVLSVMIVPGTILDEQEQAGDFCLPAPLQMLQELRLMLENSNMSRGLFMSNHASNYLPLRLRLPKDKKLGLQLLDDALSGKQKLRQEWMRGL